MYFLARMHLKTMQPYNKQMTAAPILLVSYVRLFTGSPETWRITELGREGERLRLKSRVALLYIPFSSLPFSKAFTAIYSQLCK